jgi:protein-tyrosine phosphatase
MSLTGSDADVSDPWYTGDFEGVYNDILKGCQALMEEI